MTETSLRSEALRVVYDPGYNLHFYGLERLHPFDSRKYGRAMAALRRRVPQLVELRPGGPVEAADLRLVHSEEYLDSLTDRATVARALELPFLAWLPTGLLDRRVLHPMRLATRGTMVAADEALSHGFAVNLGGGYHHAGPTNGEGFCVYADIALAIRRLRRDGRLSPEGRVVYVDLDAHQGNGVARCVLEDRSVRLFDVYNGLIYPCGDPVVEARIDHRVPLRPGAGTEAYLAILRERLPSFLDESATVGPIELAIFNAGTDIHERDPLGGLAVSADGIRARDRLVVSELRGRGIPTLFLPSGGYTPESWQLIADSLVELAVRPGEVTLEA